MRTGLLHHTLFRVTIVWQPSDFLMSPNDGWSFAVLLLSLLPSFGGVTPFFSQIFSDHYASPLPPERKNKILEVVQARFALTEYAPWNFSTTLLPWSLSTNISAGVDLQFHQEIPSFCRRTAPIFNPACLC